MEEIPSVDDLLSGYPSFFIPSRFTWSDFCDFIDESFFCDFIDDDLKGDLNES